MAIKLIVFDLDGTLFDTRADIVNAVNRARASYGLPALDFDRVVAMVGNGVQVLAERVFRDSPIVPEAARERIMEFYGDEAANTAQLYPGVAETLPRLQARLAVVSNKPTELVHSLLKRNGLDSLFEYVAGGDTFERLKPDPMALHFIMERFQTAANEILVVGDHSPDIEMAHAAGAFSVYCNYGFFGKDRVGADVSIDSFPELLEVVGRIEAGAVKQGGRKAAASSAAERTSPGGDRSFNRGGRRRQDERGHHPERHRHPQGKGRRQP
ncbi:MAG: HAD family hydrolase [Acidobacteria bacterium]|nr:MAG: HAD family hydrolase [Acidobacteriota bacterium]